MILQTQKISLEGFDRIQELLMRIKLSDIEMPKGNIHIELHQDVEYGKCDCSWYGGLMATVTRGGDELSLLANGDVIVTLLNKEVNDEVAYVRDKSNGGSFYSQMSQYIKNDAQLYEIMENKDDKYCLEFSNNNWYEIFVDKWDGTPDDESVVCDSTNIFDAIAEMVSMLAEFSKTKR